MAPMHTASNQEIGMGDYVPGLRRCQENKTNGTQKAAKIYFSFTLSLKISPTKSSGPSVTAKINFSSVCFQSHSRFSRQTI
jgi:hypothetical protein